MWLELVFSVIHKLHSQNFFRTETTVSFIILIRRWSGAELQSYELPPPLPQQCLLHVLIGVEPKLFWAGLVHPPESLKVSAFHLYAHLSCSGSEFNPLTLELMCRLQGETSPSQKLSHKLGLHMSYFNWTVTNRRSSASRLLKSRNKHGKEIILE